MGDRMSRIHDNTKMKEESYPVAPDSTTADRVIFAEQDDVLFHREDGFFYFGSVVQVQEDKCLVHFGDDTERWASYRDLRKVKFQDEASISCILCKSVQSASSDNQILTCNYCRRGYHQKCHEPSIPNHFCTSDMHWMCTRCVQKKQMREKVLNNRPVNNNDPAKAIKRTCRSFPYDLASLSWDRNHHTNVERKYCYCGQDGEWARKMLQCCKCCQWFHGGCVSALKHELLFGDRFYLFHCSVCNNGAEEQLLRLSDELTLPDLAHLALYNLNYETARKYHDLDKSVIPFLEKHWSHLELSDEIKSLPPSELRTRILGIFWQHKNRFMCGRELKKKKTMWGLRLRLPPSFPAELSPRSKRMLKLWTGSESTPLNSLTSDIVPCSPISTTEAEPASKKRTRASLNPVVPTPTNEAPSADEKSSNSSDVQRRLRVRQQRVTSEESLCDESSDDVKPASVAAPVPNQQGNKRKRCASVSPTAPIECQTSSDEASSSRGTLDVFIPPPKNFEGLNNPFSSAVDQRVKSSYLLVRPLKTRLSEKDIRITKTGEVKRRRLVRKWKRCSSGSSLAASSGPESFFHQVDQSLTFISPSSYSPKESVMSYFGVEERVARGEKYAVHARRILPKGPVQYLIQWEADTVS